MVNSSRPAAQPMSYRVEPLTGMNPIRWTFPVTIAAAVDIRGEPDATRRLRGYEDGVFWSKLTRSSIAKGF
jgi:hypothetical protein